MEWRPLTDDDVRESVKWLSSAIANLMDGPAAHLPVQDDLYRAVEAVHKPAPPQDKSRG